MTVSVRNNVNEHGRRKAQPILFAHGFGCDQNMWRFVWPRFEADYRVVLFDHVGAGGSELSAYDPERYSSLQGYAEDVMAYGWALVELIEAGVRAERPDEAAAALDRLSERTRASGTDWALGVEAGSRALLSERQDAEPLYLEAVERLERSRGVVHLARFRLLYGEWLRRENRRRDAREQLRVAHDAFSGIGAEAFAERARRELQATGGTARKRRGDTRDDLTPQEAQIARLARDGLSNPEIGARLFISPRTVQYHLHKVYAKLDISSRNQLSRVPASHLS